MSYFAWHIVSPSKCYMSILLSLLIVVVHFLLESDVIEDACSLDSVPEYIKVFLSFPPSGNGKLASWTSILGFVVMMSLDVGLG